MLRRRHLTKQHAQSTDKMYVPCNTPYFLPIAGAPLTEHTMVLRYIVKFRDIGKVQWWKTPLTPFVDGKV
jgi:hypothetical protein